MSCGDGIVIFILVSFPDDDMKLWFMIYVAYDKENWGGCKYSSLRSRVTYFDGSRRRLVYNDVTLSVCKKLLHVNVKTG